MYISMLLFNHVEFYLLPYIMGSKRCETIGFTIYDTSTMSYALIRMQYLAIGYNICIPALR